MPRRKKVSELNNIYPAKCKVLKAVREQDADKTYNIDRGYIRYVLPFGRTAFEHVLVVKNSGRKYPKGYVIHHKNENKKDNRSVNLEVLTVRDHSFKHFDQKPLNNCVVCGKSYRRSPKIIGKYCSKSCNLTSRNQKSNRPSKSELLSKMRSVNNYTKVGKYYGVSDNAVRKWCKHYGINTKDFDGRKATRKAR